MKTDLVKIIHLLMEKLGPVFFELEPEVFWEVLSENGYHVDRILKNKVLAGVSLLSSSAYWNDYAVFENVINAFNENVVILEDFQLPEPRELIYGLLLSGKIRKLPYSDNVLGYIASIVHLNDMVWLPAEWLPDGVMEKVMYIARHWPIDTVSQIEKMYPTINDDYRFNETAADIQLAKIVEIKKYLKEDNSGLYL